MSITCCIRLDRTAIDLQQDVARLQGRAFRGRSLGDFARHHLIAFETPEDAVLHLRPRATDRDVGDSQTEQQHHDGD